MNSSINQWAGACNQSAGLKHIQRSIPCQDYCSFGQEALTYSILCDGKGSAELSHLGSEKICTEFQSFVNKEYQLIYRLLDFPSSCKDDYLCQELNEKICLYCADILNSLSQKYNRPPSSFESTLLITLIGRQRIYTFHIGDGRIICLSDDQALTLSAPVNGEFANETHFTHSDEFKNIQISLSPAQQISAVASFSDGTEDGVFCQRTHEINPIFLDLWEALIQGKLQNEDLKELLTDPQWDQQTNDDRSLVLLARQNSGTPIGHPK